MGDMIYYDLKWCGIELGVAEYCEMHQTWWGSGEDTRKLSRFRGFAIQLFIPGTKILFSLLGLHKFPACSLVTRHSIVEISRATQPLAGFSLSDLRYRRISIPSLLLVVVMVNNL
jgi:hypothetical protein